MANFGANSNGWLTWVVSTEVPVSRWTAEGLSIFFDHKMNYIA